MSGIGGAGQTHRIAKQQQRVRAHMRSSIPASRTLPLTLRPLVWPLLLLLALWVLFVHTLHESMDRGEALRHAWQATAPVQMSKLPAVAGARNEVPVITARR